MGARPVGRIPTRLILVPYDISLRILSAPRKLPLRDPFLRRFFEMAQFNHPYPRNVLRRFFFCGAFRRVAPPGRYPAP